MSKNTIICAVCALSLLASFNTFAQWSAVDSGTTTQLRGVHLLDSGVGYVVGDGGTILKSIDSGATWNALVSGTTRTLYDVHFFDDATGVTVGDNGLILRTIDGGTSWQTMTSGVRDGLRSVSFSGANGICGGLSQDILYSSDSGATWQVAQKGFFGGGFFGAHMLSPTLGFVAGQNSIFQGFLGTTVNGGAHWSFDTFYFNGNEGNCDDVFFFDGATGVTSGVLFDGTGAIARTTNGGTSWNSIIFPNAMQGIDFPQPESGFAVGFAGTVLRSPDLGISWSAQTSGTSFDLFDVHFASDGLTGLAVGAAGTILRTTNGGREDDLELISAATRKGGFEIDLTLDGPPGIECRSGGANATFKLQLTFNHALTAVDDVTTSCGTVSRSTIDGTDAHRLLINLAGVNCNAQVVTVTLSGVHDEEGNTLPSVDLEMALLLGDVDGNGVVDYADIDAIRLDRGQATDSTNFREDLNTSGKIDSPDFAIVKSERGTMLPP
ncbi:MAG: YCF48-related protein [Spartobacteria bacterium]